MFGFFKKKKIFPVTINEILDTCLISNDYNDTLFVKRIRDKNPDWSILRTRTAITDYKWFMYASAVRGSRVPTKDVDVIWHEHLLFSKDYDEWCNTNFGKKIHHVPDPIEFNKKNEDITDEEKKSLLCNEKATPVKSVENTTPKKKKQFPVSHSSSPSLPPSKSVFIQDDPLTNYLILNEMMEKNGESYGCSPAPEVETPSYSAPDPSPSYSAPSYSDPSPSYSAPSYSDPSPSHSSCSSSSCSSSSCSSSSCSSGGD